MALNHLRATKIIQKWMVRCNTSAIAHKHFSGQVCINVDGAVSFQHRRSAVGLVARDKSGFAIHVRNIILGFFVSFMY